MPLSHTQFQSNSIFQGFASPKYSDAIIDDFLSIAEAELEEHRGCMGVQFNRIVFLLTAHRLTKWSAGGLLTIPGISPIGVMPIGEMRQLVSSLSVSDEAGSESINFQPNPSNADTGPEDLSSTSYGTLYLTLFKKYRCVRSWMVA
jgi:Protein of unknown function (DUF4054)